MEASETSFIKALAVLAGLIFVAWLVRRHIREHHQDKVQWWMREVVPRAKQWALWIFGATMLVWVIIHATAPDDARDDLGEQIKALFQPLMEPAAEDETGPPPP